MHVLSYSLHALLCALSQDLASGDLDPCLQSISDIVAEDLFGQLAEEREVPEAVSKLPEAKSSKGLATLEIVSSKLSPQLLPSLIAPLKKVGAVCASVFAMGSTAHCSWLLSLIQDTVLFHHHFSSGFLYALLHVSVFCPLSLPLSICVQAVEGRPNAKLSHQVEEALCRVSLGVQGNEGFSTDHLLLFIHGLVSDSVPQLSSSDEGR